MEVLDAIHTRRSVRKYKNTAVSQELVNKLLEAAVMAPSASNMQPWAFVVIQDPLALKKYSDQAKALWLQQMEGRPDPQEYKRLLSDPDFNLFYNAGTLIIIYGDSTNFNAGIDCSLAAQNLMLAAHAQGLGTCWIGFSTALFDSQDVKRELGVPLKYQAIAPIILGYPENVSGNCYRNKPQVLVWR